jgi:hypothetical protein
MDKLKKGDGGIQLYSGNIFKPLNPDVNTFTIEDIAQGLVETSRFGGHMQRPYKVCQHTIIMCRWFLKQGMTFEAQCALMHESDEGLGLCDMPSPIKYLPEMLGYRNLCKTVVNAALLKVGIIIPIPPIVKELDDRMKAAEAKVLMRIVPEWARNVDTSDIIIKPYRNPYYGKKVWLKLFKQLFPNYVETAQTF